MSDGGSRLESALEIWLEFQKRGGEPDQLLARHPDLRDLLESFFADEAEAPATAGERVLGDYRLIREIGRGGMGVVYEARQLTLDRRVAVKVLTSSVTARPATVARFRREALHLARLDHPGILRVLDVGEQDGEHWLAMEFVEGESLDRLLARRQQAGSHGRDALQELVAVIEQIAVALQHAHEQGIVHRDIKPSNILLRSGGEAVLGDFGLAREGADPSLTQSGTVAGTPNYMSPEQVTRSSEVDARSDVFSLGITLYECTTLRLPFAGETTDQVLHRIVHREPIDPRRLLPGVPADLVAITQKALEKDPRRRYQSAGAFAEDLRAFRELRPVRARPVSRLQQVRRWMRREPLQAALLATVLLACGLGAYLANRLPDIRAAERGRREAAYENAITTALLLRTGDVREACYREFEDALALFPRRGEAIAGFCLAVSHFAGADAGLAELERRAGVRSDDEDVERLRAWLLQRQHRDAEAAALQERLGEPRTATAMWLSAVAMIEGVDDAATMRRAERLMSLAIRVSPAPRLLIYEQWAAILTRVDDADARREAATALLTMWPREPAAMHLAAVDLLHLEPERSASLIEQALDLGLADPLARVNLAVARRAAGQTAAAIAAAHQALAQPGLGDHGQQKLNDRARSGLIDMLHDLGDPTYGEEVARWLAAEPDNAFAMRRAAQCAARNGDDDRALALFRKLHEQAPKDLDLLMDLALALSFANDYDGAIRLLHEVIAADPRHERAHRLLSDLHGDRGDADAVLAELVRWVQVKGDDAEAWQHLAEVYLLMDDPEAAPKAVDAAEHLDYLTGGRNPTVLELRARAMARLGDAAEAHRLRERAKSLPPPTKGR